MRVAAVVPFKCFTRAKRRLRTHYSDRQVEEIGRAMLADVLDALAGTRGLERVSVLTDDAAVAEVARGAGASVRLRHPDPGLNPAIDQSIPELVEAGFEASLVVQGDLPLLRGEDVDRVIDAGRDHAVVIVPSSDGGTALLFRRPPGCIAARFGPDSAQAHEAEARSQGLEPLCMTELRDTARLDLDTPDDARQLLRSDLPCRTRDLLRKFEG